MRNERPKEPENTSREDNILRDPITDHLRGKWLPILLTTDLAAYLLWLITQDLEIWGGRRKTRLTREEACDFAGYLYDGIPDPKRRREIPREIPKRRAA